MKYILIIVVACIVVIALVVITIIRIQLKNRVVELTEKIKNIHSDYDRINNCKLLMPKDSFYDIRTDLDSVFRGNIISATQKREFRDFYVEYYQEAKSLVEKHESFKIYDFSDDILGFISDFENIEAIVKDHNDLVISELLDTYSEFFDTCLKYPLDKQQRRSIISEEDNCLVVSSAGSGKTSSIVGKVKYLVDIKGVEPQKILLISYTNKAAAELTERIGMNGLRGYTFHKLAIDLIGRELGIKPSICDNTDALFVEIYRELLNNPDFKKNVLGYFVDYQIDEEEWEQCKNQRREHLAEQKKAKLKTIFPDMDGKPIYVRSVQEQKICFALSALGVRFKYEEPYEYPVANEMYSQYSPDYSIYFEQNGENKRIYLEHLGIDDHGLVPAWFAKDKNISHEEANRLYNDGISWKKAVHEKFGTKLLITTSADFHYFDIRNKLKELLITVGVPIQEKTDEELYDLILPQGSKQEKAFIRLAVTFVTLVKSSCKSVKEILRQAENAYDRRSEDIIKNIFTPIYERYSEVLNSRGQIDFTDAILKATEICQSSHPVSFDYIIVDEFQDISVDRYHFLNELRRGNPPAKLYCVGDDWQSIYRFSGSDMSLFSQFPNYFGVTEINKIETTYRFGEPLVSLSSRFIQRNKVQIQKNISSFDSGMRTDLEFYSYDRRDYCNTIGRLVASVPLDKTIFLLGRYSFDDYYLSYMYQAVKEGNRFYYIICGRKIEFLTVHKSKGLEADYVILLQCNKDVYGFPSLVGDDPVLNYVLTERDQFPFGEERRLFYVAITRAKIKTMVLYDSRFPSVFVEEFLHPEKISEESYEKHPNANKRWTKRADQYLLNLHQEGKSIRYIANKMGRSQTSIVMRLNKLKQI